MSGCLSSSSIPFFYSEATLLPLRVILTHFVLSSYERTRRLPTSFPIFPISSLAKFGVKPKLCRCFWRAFAFTLPLKLPSTSPGENLFACPPFPPWNLTFSSRSSPFLFSLTNVRLSPTLTLSHLMIWCSGQTVLFLFLLANMTLAYVVNCSLCGTEATLSFSAGPVCSSFFR